MSLLLEALQRADSERKHQGDVPGIDTEHSIAINTRPAQSRHWILIVLALIILLLLVYVIYLQSAGTTPTDSSDIADSVVVESEPAQIDPQSIAIVDNTSPPTTSPPAGSVRVESNTTPADVAALYERLQAENSSNAMQQTPGKVGVATSHATTELEAGFGDGNEERYADIDQQNAAEEVYSSIPFASQLPDHQQDRIPSLRYTTHGYAEETGKGLVTLNGRTQRRGDTIAPGLVLLDIRADYIVLDMNGVLFRLPAATDWN